MEIIRKFVFDFVFVVVSGIVRVQPVHRQRISPGSQTQSISEFFLREPGSMERANSSKGKQAHKIFRTSSSWGRYSFAGIVF